MSHLRPSRLPQPGTIHSLLDSRAITSSLTDGYADTIARIVVGEVVCSHDYEMKSDGKEGKNASHFLGNVYEGSEETHAFVKVKTESYYDDSPWSCIDYMSLKSESSVEDEIAYKAKLKDDEARRAAGEKIPWETHRYFYDIRLPVHSNYREGFTAETWKVLECHAKEACYGDALEEATKIDHSVRKGKDIEIASLVEKDLMKIHKDFLRMLSYKFYEFSGINGVEVKPYKINYYQKGDHFVAHRDSPEKGLVGTIVFHLAGEYGSFTIGPDDDQQTWIKEDGPILMFYPETVHRVSPVESERWTMTFKVFRNYPDFLSDLLGADDAAHPVRADESGAAGAAGAAGAGAAGAVVAVAAAAEPERPITKPFESSKCVGLACLAKRIDFTQKFSILLNRGYSYIGVKTVNELLQCLKGVDLSIFMDLQPLLTSGQYTMSVVPVVVTNTKVLEESYSYNDSDSDSDGEDDGYGSRSRESFVRNNKSDANGYKGLPSDIDDDIVISNVPEEFLDLMNSNMMQGGEAAAGAADAKASAKDEDADTAAAAAAAGDEPIGLPIDPLFRRIKTKYGRNEIVYYLGCGYRFSSIQRRNLYIGNGNSGRTDEQIYFNLMLHYMPRKN